MISEIAGASASSLAMLRALVTTVNFTFERLRFLAISAVVVPESRIIVSFGCTSWAAACPIRAFSER